MNRVYIFLCLFGAIIFINLYLFFSPWIRVEEIQVWIQAHEFWAPLLYILVFACTPFFPFLSAAWAIAGGLLFGVWWGSLFICLGATLSASVGFFLTRFFLHVLQKKKLYTRIEEVHKKIRSGSLFTLFILRLLPLFPFDLISYAAGLSQISYKNYILISTVAMVPGVFLYAGIGNFLLHPSLILFLFLVILIVIFTACFIFKNTIKRRLGFLCNSSS